MSRWHRDNPEKYEELRAEARRQVREEANEPITDYHKFESLAAQREAELEAEYWGGQEPYEQDDLDAFRDHELDEDRAAGDEGV
jgi:hypothetical protein